MTRFGARKGAWAVVTGATDGIGKEFASQLAKSGFNIILVARNKDLLSQSAAEIGLFSIYILYILLTRMSQKPSTKYPPPLIPSTFPRVMKAHMPDFLPSVKAMILGF